MNEILFASVYCDFIHWTAPHTADFASSLLGTLHFALWALSGVKQQNKKQKKNLSVQKVCKRWNKFTFDVRF